MNEVARIPDGPWLGIRPWGRPLKFAGALALAVLAITVLWLTAFRTGKNAESTEMIAVIADEPEPAPGSEFARPQLPENQAAVPRGRILRPGIHSVETDRHATTEHSRSEGRPLRLELQTADPNIRIIWFVPQKPVRNDTGPIGG